MRMPALRKEWRGSALLLALSLLHTWWRYSLPGITADGQTYLQIARNIHYGAGLGWQALWAPPLHSVLIALAGWLPGVPDLKTAAGIVSPLAGALLPLAVYLLASRAFNRTTALAAGILAVFFPHFDFIQFSPEAEVTYTLLLILSLYLTLKSFQEASLSTAAAAGMSWALTWMGRSEGFLVMALTLGMCGVVQARHSAARFARLTALLLAVFALTASPYLFFLKQHYGKLTMSPKATYVLIWMKSRIYHDNDKGEVDNDELWGLTPDYRLKWQTPSGFGELAGYLMSHPEKSARVYLHNVSLQIPGRIPNNSGIQHYPQVFPIYLSLAALFAAFRRWGDGSPLKKAVIFAPLLILLILPVFTEGWWKYLVPYAPLLIISASGGLFMLPGQQSRRYLPWAVTLFLAGYFAYCLIGKPAPPPNSNVQMRRAYAEQAGKAARWIRARYGPGKNYMVAWNKMIYELDGLWTADPVADLPAKLEYARRNRVDYYLMEFSASQISPVEIMLPPPGLALDTVYQSPDSDYCVAVYRLASPFPQPGSHQ